MALLLANGSMSSNSSGEGDIRRALIEADLVECMVALPGQLFTNTQIPACIWFLTKNKAKRSRPGAAALRDRRGETLFIDAGKLGFMKNKVLRDFTKEDVEAIAGTFGDWRSDAEKKFQEGRKAGRIHEMRDYKDIPGFSRAAHLHHIKDKNYVLSPGDYVGTGNVEQIGEPFDDKMARLIGLLDVQFEESARLESAIRSNMKGLGYAG
jgi:type I restriction enzyme M protein